MKNNLLLASALKYATVLGWPVFPCKPKSKAPACEHGFKDATTDPAQIEKWWTENPNANIGIATGVNFDVLDVDPRNGGNESLEALVAEHGPLPHTAQQMSGGGGRHYLFAINGAKGSGEVAPGLDLKAKGGYILGAPSVHPETGKRYVWDGAALLENQSILPAPAWVKKKSSSRGDRAIAEKISQDRNVTLTSLAGSMRLRGLGEQTILAALIAVNKDQCHPPLPPAEVKRIASSIARYPAGGDDPGSYSRTATVNIEALEPDVDLLNALVIFGARVRFQAVKRRGPLVVALTAKGEEIIWYSTTDLTCFSRSQAIIADATGVLIPTPSRSRVKALWEPAAQLLLQLAGRDKVTTGAALVDEFSSILQSVWEQAGEPTILENEPEKLVNMLQLCVLHFRDPKGGPPSCCIWLAEGFAWCHQPSLMEWLSTPAGKNKHYSWTDVRAALLLLGFTPTKDLTRSVDNNIGKASVWRGPASFLVD